MSSHLATRIAYGHAVHWKHAHRRQMKVVPSPGSAYSPLWASRRATKPPSALSAPTCTRRKQQPCRYISNWWRKTAFCSACALWCRQIRSLWLSTDLRKTTYSVTDRLYLHQCTKQHQELLPGDGAHLMTQTANLLQTSTVCFTPRHTTPLPHNPRAWFGRSRARKHSQQVALTQLPPLWRSATLIRANPCQQASGSENHPGDI